MDNGLSGLVNRMNPYDTQMESFIESQEKIQSENQILNEKLSSLTSLTNENKRELDRLKSEKATTDIEHQKAIEFHDQEIAEARKMILQLQDSLTEQQSIQTNLTQSLDHIKKCNSKSMRILDEKIDQVDSKTRKNNIIIDGQQKKILRTLLLNLSIKLTVTYKLPI